MTSQKSRESGNILLEFLVISFLIFLIPLATFNLSELLHKKQIATVLSKELADTVYRECVSDNLAFPTPRTDPPDSRFDPRLCVADTVENQFRIKIQNLFPECQTNANLCPKLAVSLFGSNTSGSEAERDFYMSDDPHDVEFEKYNRNKVVADARSRSSSDLGNALKEYQVLVIAQVRVPISGPNAAIGWLFNSYGDRMYGIAIV